MEVCEGLNKLYIQIVDILITYSYKSVKKEGGTIQQDPVPEHNIFLHFHLVYLLNPYNKSIFLIQERRKNIEIIKL